MSYTFDTNEAARKMEEAGVTQPQADAIVETLSHATRELATTKDLEAAERRLDTRIDTLRSEFKEQISEQTAKLIRFQLATTGVLFIMLRIF